MTNGDLLNEVYELLDQVRMFDLPPKRDDSQEARELHDEAQEDLDRIQAECVRLRDRIRLEVFRKEGS